MTTLGVILVGQEFPVICSHLLLSSKIGFVKSINISPILVSSRSSAIPSNVFHLSRNKINVCHFMTAQIFVSQVNLGIKAKHLKVLLAKYYPYCTHNEEKTNERTERIKNYRNLARKKLQSPILKQNGAEHPMFQRVGHRRFLRYPPPGGSAILTPNVRENISVYRPEDIFDDLPQLGKTKKSIHFQPWHVIEEIKYEIFFS